MPVAGRKPKADGEKRHRVPPRHDWVEVLDTPYAGAVPKLPRRDGGWPARAKRKWDVWCRMPHCLLWTESDWEFALDTIELVAQFYRGNERLGTEIRNREKVLGTTADYRRDLRIRYVEAQEQPEAADVSNISDYRERL